MGKWRRRNDFLGFGREDYTIIYDNFAPFSLFRRLDIYICRRNPGNPKIKIFPFPNHSVNRRIIDLFSPGRVCINAWYITTDVDLRKLKSDIEYIESTFKKQALTDDLKTEIDEIFAAVQSPSASAYFHHRIEKEIPFDRDHQRITEIIDLLITKPVDLTRKIKRALINGANVHRTMGGISALRCALKFTHIPIEVVELLLMYGANPIQPDQCNTMESPLEALIDMVTRYPNEEFNNKFAVIKHLASGNPNKEISKIPACMISKIITTREHAHTNTTISFNSGMHIDITVKSGDQLDPEEKQCLTQLIPHYFECAQDPDGKKLQQDTYDDFTRQGTIFEILRHNDKIIGFHLLASVCLSNHPHDITLYGIYLLVDPKYRGLTMMPLLVYRLAYALQLLLPNINVSLLIDCVDYNAYRLFDHASLLYPKYQPQHLNERVRELLDYLTHGEHNLFHDLITCYFLEKVRSKSAHKSAVTEINFNRKLFEEHLRGGSPTDPDEIRAVPIFMYTSDKHFSQLSSLGVKLGINYLEEIIQLAVRIQLDLSKFCPANAIASPYRHSAFTQTGLLFWRNMAKASEMITAPRIRARY